MTNFRDDYNLLNLGGLTSLVTNVNVSLWGNEVLIELLNLGGLTSLVKNVKVSWWGNEVLLECIYDPTGDRLPITNNQ